MTVVICGAGPALTGELRGRASGVEAVLEMTSEDPLKVLPKWKALIPQRAPLMAPGFSSSQVSAPLWTLWSSDAGRPASFFIRILMKWSVKASEANRFWRCLHVIPTGEPQCIRENTQ